MNLKAKPKLDLVFKKLFGDVANTEILTSFLCSVLDIKEDNINKIEIIDNEIIPEDLEKKFSRLDLLLQANNEYINIEIQVNNYNDFKERTLFYWSKIYSNQLGKGEDYITLKDTIAINIVDFNLFNAPKSHSTFGVYESETHEKLTDKLRIDFLELPKAKKYKTNKNLQEWLDFLNVTTEEGLSMIEKNTTIPVMHKAIAVVRQMSADEKLLRDIQKREETLMNERSALYVAEQRGAEKAYQELIVLWKSQGRSDEEINELLGK